MSRRESQIRMSFLAETPPASLEIEPRVGTERPTRFRLLPSGDGWSLVAPDGTLVFEGLGYSGRQRCLEFARAQGVLAVFS
jgi:hypothetical protein